MMLIRGSMCIEKRSLKEWNNRRVHLWKLMAPHFKVMSGKLCKELSVARLE
jgi:hypothetical protein